MRVDAERGTSLVPFLVSSKRHNTSLFHLDLSVFRNENRQLKCLRLWVQNLQIAACASELAWIGTRAAGRHHALIDKQSRGLTAKLAHPGFNLQSNQSKPVWVAHACCFD